MSRLHLIAALTSAVLLSATTARADDYCINPTVVSAVSDADHDASSSAAQPMLLGDATALEVTPVTPESCTPEAGCTKGPICAMALLGGVSPAVSGNDDSCWAAGRNGACVTHRSSYAFLQNQHASWPADSGIGFTLMTWKLDAVPVGYSIPVAEVALQDAKGRESRVRLVLRRVGTSGQGDFELALAGSLMGRSGARAALREAPVRLVSRRSAIRLDWGNDLDPTHSGKYLLRVSIDGQAIERQLPFPIASGRSAVGNLGALTIGPAAADLGFGDLYFRD